MFTLNLTMPNGAVCKFHAARSIYATLPSDLVIAQVASYENELQLLSSEAPRAQTPINVPVASLGANLARSVELFAIAEVGGAFFGGVMAAQISSDPLSAAKYRKMVELKIARDLAFAAIDLDLTQTQIDQQVKAIRDKGVALKAAVQACLTVEEVAAIVW